jgi:hypothetical protein
MNPAIIQALIAAMGPALMALNKGGKEGEFGSTYSQAQQGAQNQFIGGLPQGQQDITQNQNYQTGTSYLNDLFNDPNFFNKFEAPMQRQFQEQTILSLFNKFASMGTGGSFGTDFANATAREARNLQDNIAALRGNMQQNAIPQLLGYAQQPTQNLMSQYGLALGQPTNNVYRPATPGPLGEIGASITGSTAGSWGDIINQLFKGGNGNSQQNKPTVGLGQTGY